MVTGDQPKAIFNIGSQQGNVSNVAGDMTVHGGQHYVGLPVEAMRQDLASVRREIAGLGLDTADRAEAEALLADAGRELDRHGHDPDRVAGPVLRLVRLLREAGAFAAAGTALIDPLHRIASCLGGAGQAIVHLLM
jgi:hypothetical protein